MSTQNVAVIPGGTGSVGRCLLPLLLERDFRIATTYLLPDEATNLEEQLDFDEDRLILRRVDITDAEATGLFMREAAEAFGEINVMVSLVGGWTGGRDVAETDDVHLDRMLDLNLRSAWNVTRAAIPLMSEEWGRIILMGSKHATDTPTGQAAYNVAFAALQLKQYDNGLKRAAAFLSDYPDHALMPDAKYVLAECNLHLGKNAEAQKAYGELVAGRPDHADLQHDQLEDRFAPEATSLTSWFSKSGSLIEPPPRDYLVEQLIPATVAALLSARGGTGKGYLELLLALHLALGRDLGRLAEIEARAIDRPREVGLRSPHDADGFDIAQLVGLAEHTG